MNCRDVCTWFLSADDPATLPAEVGRHLSACRRCRNWQARALRLNAEVRRPPALLARPAARARFLERLDALPAPTAPPRVPALRRWVYRAAAVAAVLLLAIGLLWLVPASRKKVDPGAITSDPPGRATKDDVAIRLLRRDMALAESVAPPEQLWELAGMAGDLRDEAMRQAQAESAPDLTLVASLYQRVLRVGIVGRANVLPDDTSRSLLRPLSEELRTAADETDRLAAAALPDRAETLRAMGATAREISQRLAEPVRADPVNAPERITAALPLLEVLVLHGLLLVAEDDPLHRAAHGNEVVGILAEKFRAPDAASDARLVALSDQFSALLERTVVNNLNRADADAIDPERVAEIDRARHRADEATDALERNLDNAPPAARKGLEKAVNAGKSKPKDKSKGKGKAGTNDDPDDPPKEKHVPPGLDKKPKDKSDHKKQNKEDD